MSTDTRPVLATLNLEQIAAVLEVLRAAPDHLNSDSVADVLETTLREARDYAFELEKLTKAAVEDVINQTGSAPSPQLVGIIVQSVWGNIHAARSQHGEYDEGLLPGFESELADQGTSSVPESVRTAQQVLENLGVGQTAPLTSAPNVRVPLDPGTPQPPVQEQVPVVPHIVRYDTETSIITDVSDKKVLDQVISEAAQPVSPVLASSPRFGLTGHSGTPEFSATEAELSGS